MDTIKNYCHYFKDISFEESPFNDVDNILLSTIVYLDFKDIVKEPITMKEAGKKFFEQNTFKTLKNYSLSIKQIIQNFKIIYDHKRYKDIILSNYEKIVYEEKQFCALTYELPDGTLYIGYEGTDDSMIGWQEDFELIYKFPVPAQKCAITYINKIIKYKNKKVLVGGHSKGGNLAMTASMYAKPYIKRRIVTVYNNDGPGFRKEQYESKEFKQLLPKLKMFVPSECVVGFLLRHPKQYMVVKSSGKGLLQHNANTWNCYGPVFIKGELSPESKKIEKRILSWLDKHNDEQRKLFVESLFDIFKKSDITLCSQLRQIKISRMIRFIQVSRKLDKESKELILSVIRVLFFSKEEREGKLEK